MIPPRVVCFREYVIVYVHNIINNVCTSLGGTRDGFLFVSTLWLELSSTFRYIKYNIIIMLCIINTSAIPVYVCVWCVRLT